MEDYEISSYLKMIRIKYKLTTDVVKYLNEEKYPRCRDLLLQILYHELYTNDYYPYFELAKLFKTVEDFKKEREIITEFFKSSRYCPSNVLDYFKNRLKELNVKNIDKLLNQYDKSGATNKDLCNMPVLSADEILHIDLQSFKLNSKFSRDFTKLDGNASFEDKIRFKLKLIKKAEEFLKNKNHILSLQYFDRLISHPLFENDVYPYWCISEIFKALKQSDARKYYILKFFKSGIYCSTAQLKGLTDALRECGCENIDDILEQYKNNGFKNEYYSNIPVPSADEIINSYKLIDESLDEKIVLEMLFKKIPRDYVFKSTNSIVEDYSVDFKEDSDEKIVKMVKIDLDTLAERRLMLNALQLIRNGKSRREVASILNINITKIYRWIYRGEIAYSLNTYYFFSQLNEIEKIKRDIRLNRSKYIDVNNFDDIFTNFSTDVKLSTVDLNDEKLIKLIKEYERFFSGPYYNSGIKKYNLTTGDVESIKHRILDEILLEDIKGDDVDFSAILKDYCMTFSENKRRLNDDEFDEIFDRVEVGFYDEGDVYQCKLKTIRDYNMNFIVKNSIEERFRFYLAKKHRENHQLSRLDEIMANPDTPEIKKYLTSSEKNRVYLETKEIICSEHGLKGIVLDFVRLNMDKIAKEKMAEALDEFGRFKKDLSDITDLNNLQISDFSDEFEELIKNYEIRPEDISRDYIYKLSVKYSTFGKIII